MPGARVVPPAPGGLPIASPSRARIAVALLIVGIGLLNVADEKWAHAIGVVSLFGVLIVAFAGIVPWALATDA